MKKTITLIILGFALAFFVADVYAQTVTIDGVFRPRYEYRHGFKTIFPEDGQAANFISQRSRLGLKFENDKFKVGFSIQNVGVWGETGTLSKEDVNGTAVHEAWGEFIFNEVWSFKAGRQEIIYDDHRIFGSVDWAQQGRSHDAAIVKIKPNENHNIDVGFAYNAMNETLEKQYYNLNNYKTFQYAHWHGKFGSFGVSILALFNGKAYVNPHDTTNAGVAKENIVYTRTVGPRFSFKKDAISANLAFYSQGGKNTVVSQTTGNDSIMNVSAIYFGIDFLYTIAKKFTVGVGMEYLSGNDEKDNFDSGLGKETENAFTPLYGTNHKFNGWMDYFYVGNHVGSVGLMDIFIPLKFKKDKFSAALIPHFFSCAGTLYRQERDENWDLVFDGATPVMKEIPKGLGTEVDFVFGYALSKSAVMKAGYSVMFASESMEYLKGRQAKTGNSWGWVMFIFKPTFYKSNKG